ncbi:MAG: DnaJ domain-containing protein [Bacillales bacterium]|nr:DnaJ domain-containing protein [Bacillales bacterium]
MLLFIAIILFIVAIFTLFLGNLIGLLLLLIDFFLFYIWTIVNRKQKKFDRKIVFIRQFYFDLQSSPNITSKEREDNTKSIDTLSKLIAGSIRTTEEIEEAIEDEYNRIFHLYQNLEQGIADKHLMLSECEIPYSSESLNKTIQDSKQNITKLTNTDALINYLLLLTKNKEARMKGYESYNYSKIGFPNNPKDIHIDAFVCILTKNIIDNWDSALSLSLLSLFNNTNEKDAIKKLINDLYKTRVRKLEELFKKEGSKEILPIILFLDPTFSGEKYVNSGLYERLGLTPDATKEEVEEAYRKLLVTEHPDRGGSTEEWEKTNEAYAKIKEDIKTKSK